MKGYVCSKCGLFWYSAADVSKMIDKKCRCGGQLIKESKKIKEDQKNEKR